MKTLPQPPPNASGALAAILDAIRPWAIDVLREAVGRSPVLTAEQICAEFPGVADKAIRSAVRRHELACRRIGHARVFSRSDVERWLLSRTARWQRCRPGACGMGCAMNKIIDLFPNAPKGALSDSARDLVVRFGRARAITLAHLILCHAIVNAPGDPGVSEERVDRVAAALATAMRALAVISSELEAR